MLVTLAADTLLLYELAHKLNFIAPGASAKRRRPHISGFTLAAGGVAA
jgi:hypothetical protein